MGGVDVGPSLKKYSVVLSVFILHSFGVLNGAVTVSPSGMVTVCDGDRLELTCMISDPGTSFTILQWNVTLELNLPRSYDRVLSSSAPSDQNAQIVVSNSTTLTFSRVSVQNEFPLVSRLLIDAVPGVLNVRCRDEITLESSTTVVNVTNGHPIAIQEVNLSEEYQFEKDGITLTLEWNETDSTYSYKVATVPVLPLNFSTNTRVHVKVPYNSLHNVSVTVSSCGQYNTTVFYKEVFCSKCKNPQDQVNDRVRVLDFMEPALEESNVTFGCLSGPILSGPHTSTCLRNGTWEPDPREVTCTDPVNCPSPSQPPNGYILPYTSTLEGATLTYVCWSVQHGTGLCGEVNRTAVCTERGQWEPSADDICTQPRGRSNEPLSPNGKIAVASSVTVFAVASVVFFIVGFLCGHFCQKKRKLNAPSSAGAGESVPPLATGGEQTQIPYYDDVVLQQEVVELKDNVAYGPIQ